MSTKNIILGIITAGIVAQLVLSLPLTQVLLSHYAVPLADVPRGEVDATWRDGTYVGRAVNQRGETVVLEVAINAGRLEHIENLNPQITALVSNKVLREMTPVILKKNSVDVDTLAGATVSSRGILTAVHNAIEQAQPPALPSSQASDGS